MRRALVVGAERGLGLGLAEELSRRGWGVTGTFRPGTDPSRLGRVAELAEIDVTDAAAVEPFVASLGERAFELVFMNAGIFGALHQSAVAATDAEILAIMTTNTFGPIRLAHRLLEAGRLVLPGGTLAFMSSHRASIAINVEGGLELYRASKVALNMLARGIHATNRERGLTVLLVHPGWVNTAMGTLDGTVAAEIELAPSVDGVATVVERHLGSGENVYCDWLGRALAW